MSSSDVAISVRELSKSYTIAHNQQRATTIAEALVRRLRNPMAKAQTETFWALKDVSFDIKRGDVVGIIGRNGAGKSTLLKILSRITEPTKGEIDLFGRVGSLLEVGTGFHPELTGRENIYLNGGILGMTRREIARQFDAIVDFAEVEKFLDTPVKRYSSGMYVRLAFAVAAHLNPEILIVDEVLAVGDADFQKKCLGKMKDVSSQGRTVLFVSHNIAAIRQLCTSAVLLEQGTLKTAGPIEDVVQVYLSKARDKSHVVRSEHGLSLERMEIRNASTQEPVQSLDFGAEYELAVKVSSESPFRDFGLVLRIVNEKSEVISSICTPEEGIEPFELNGDTEFTFPLRPISLLPGRYSVDLYVYRPHDSNTYLEVPDATEFDVEPGPAARQAPFYGRQHGIIRMAASATVRR